MNHHLNPLLEPWRNRLICGDALKIMQTLPERTLDLIVTSPPYNLLNSTGNGMKGKGGGRWKNAALKEGYADHTDCLPREAYVAWQRRCLEQMMRLLSPAGAIFYNHKWRVQGGLLQDHADILKGFPVRQIIIWQRRGGLNFNKGYFLPTCEVIYLITQKKFVLAPGANSRGDVWTIAQDTNNPHPAPFPEELVEQIMSSTTASVVLDPFMGSGTTAVVSRKLGRSFIGIELSSAYCALAQRRLDGQNWQDGRKKTGRVFKPDLI